MKLWITLAALGAAVASAALTANAASAEQGAFLVTDTCNNESGAVVPCTDARIARKLELVTSYEERFDHDHDGHLKISVRFNKDLDPKSIVVGKTVFLDAPLDHNATGKIVLSVTGFEFVADKRRAELFPAGPNDINFVFTVKAGPGGAEATDGTFLAGRDGGAQGDYVVHYACRNMDPFWCK